jgi:hypothetical protein
MDPYKLLSLVAHHQTEAYGSDLEDIAKKQEMNLDKKRAYRDLQKYAQKVLSDDVVEPGEAEKLQAWMQELGVVESGENIMAGVTADGSGNYQLGSTEDATQRKNKENFKAQVTDAIENAIKDVEDTQSKDQFEIQMATSDLQNAESVRQQAYKKMDESRDKGTDAWGQG